MRILIPRRMLTLEKSKSPAEVAEIIKRSFGSLLALLSGLIMYVDKFVEFWSIQVDYEFKYYYDLDTFLWTVGQTVAMLLLIFSYFFKPYKWSLLAPLTVFSIQIIYVWRDELWIQRDYYIYYTVAFILSFLATVFLMKWAIVISTVLVARVKNKKIESIVDLIDEITNVHYKKQLNNALRPNLIDDASDEMTQEKKDENIEEITKDYEKFKASLRKKTKDILD
ncbi:hypothetical protein L0P88_10070 [Muricauda sp. SCSIO 64092]|uniref:hypothetical protein n=1 Tax=Allomuricauda sp. SCSIO 64092 TaxID=2908842 RepID=UPI001FF523D8|nr:hypothetical protein [Muricauda sp. SCSIO 64092]UOY08879.1 hypothetical protein L0P88_10070 [Muricauda sp. SCSIO 64092]